MSIFKPFGSGRGSAAGRTGITPVQAGITPVQAGITPVQAGITPAVSISYPSLNPQGSTRAREGSKKPSAPRWEFDPGVEVPLSVRRARSAHLKRLLASPVPLAIPRDTWIEPEKWSR